MSLALVFLRGRPLIHRRSLFSNILLFFPFVNTRPSSFLSIVYFACISRFQSNPLRGSTSAALRPNRRAEDSPAQANRIHGGCLVGLRNISHPSTRPSEFRRARDCGRETARRSNLLQARRRCSANTRLRALVPFPAQFPGVSHRAQTDEASCFWPGPPVLTLLPSKATGERKEKRTGSGRPLNLGALAIHAGAEPTQPSA